MFNNLYPYSTYGTVFRIKIPYRAYSLVAGNLLKLVGNKGNTVLLFTHLDTIDNNPSVWLISKKVSLYSGT